MSNLEELIRMLIDSGESEKIEFKSQYEISKSWRAEAVRDLIAMANTHGERPGHILLGVSDDGRIVGLPTQLDSAKLEEWLNGLIDPRVDFRYSEAKFEEGRVGVIEVPFSHQRFHLVKNDLNGTNERESLKKGQSWIRHNSSKRPPTRWDMAEMKAAFAKSIAPEPKLKLEFEQGGTELEVTTAWLDMRDSQQDSLARFMSSAVTSRDPFYEPGKFSLQFRLFNEGNTAANGISIFITIPNFVYFPTLNPTLRLISVLGPNSTHVDEDGRGIRIRFQSVTHKLYGNSDEVELVAKVRGQRLEFPWEAHAENMTHSSSGVLYVTVN